MNITTEYKTNGQGRSQIVAKVGGRQRTVNYDQSKSSDWNHGNAAGTVLLASPDANISVLADADWKHTANDSGTVHRFTL